MTEIAALASQLTEFNYNLRPKSKTSVYMVFEFNKTFTKSFQLTHLARFVSMCGYAFTDIKLLISACVPSLLVASSLKHVIEKTAYNREYRRIN